LTLPPQPKAASYGGFEVGAFEDESHKSMSSSSLAHLIGKTPTVAVGRFGGGHPAPV
jgi:hypothetical protein